MFISGLALDILVKATLLLLITFAIDRILNQASAAVKHRLWGTCFVLLLLLPLLSVSVPQWRLAVLPTWWRVSESVEPIVSSVPIDVGVRNSGLAGGSSQQADLDSNMNRKAGYPNVDKASFASDNTVFETPLSNSEVAPSASSAKTLPDQVEQSSMAKAMQFLPICLWLFGVLIASFPLIVGIIRTHRIKRQSKQICDPDSTAFVSELCRLLGIRRQVSLIECPQSLVPMTWGISKPFVVLPAVWRDWMVDCQRQVLLHELAHVKRFDVLYHLIARIACSLYWFHPLVWIALRQMRAEREMACDDCVVMVGVRPSSYAQQLLNIARDYQAMDLPPAVSMAQRTGLEQRVRSLLDKARSHLPVTPRAGIALLCAGLAFALLLGAIRLEAIAESAVSDTEKDVTAQATTTEQPSEKPQPAKSKKFIYEGTVRDPDKKPVADAKLYFVFAQQGHFPDTNLKPLATTDASGRFKFEVDPDDYDRLGMDYWKFAALFAAKEGWGVAWKPSWLFETTGAMKTQVELAAAYMNSLLKFETDMTLELVSDEQPIEGQIINVDGQPVKGATLKVKEVSWNSSGTLDDWEKAVKHEKADYYSVRQSVTDKHNGFQLASVIPHVVTDANGGFILRGIGSNRIVELIVSGPTIETVIVKCRTRDGEKVVLPHEFRSSGRSQSMGGIADEVYYPRKFTYIAAPSIPIIGRVTDVETREPIADCLVTAGRTFTFTGDFKSHIVAKTDQDGRYRLEGLPLQEGEFYIVPPTSTPYVPWGGSVKFEGNRDSVNRDVALRKAVLISGRAIDGRTNKPIAGVVEFLSFAKNSRLDDYKGFAGSGGHQVRTDKDGNYSITAVPGEGVLTFMALDHTKYQRAGAYPKRGTLRSSPSADSGMKETVPHLMFTADRHWVKDIVVPDAGPLNVEITLSSGETLSGQLLGEDGKPVSEAIFSGAIEHSGWRPITKDRFEIEGYYPDKPRALYFYQRSTNTAAYLKLQGKITEPIQVTLKSAATLKGQIVDQDGAPMTNMILTGEAIPSDNFGDVSYRLTTDGDGRFEIRGLVPGQTYSIFGARDGYSSNVVRDVLVDKREVVDLGVIKINQGDQN